MSRAAAPHPARATPGAGATLEATFLRGARRGLTLWYTAVLVATLVVLGSVLYFGQRDLLLRPVVGMTRGLTELMAQDWRRTPAQPCQPPEPDRPPQPRQEEPRERTLHPRLLVLRGRAPLYLVCFDPNGGVLAAAVLPGEQTGPPPEGFLVPSLVEEAIRTGEANDRIDGGEAGPVYRLARAVRDPAGGTLGVVMAGRSVAEQVGALALLRNGLFLIGGLAVLVATLGSLFLANRALAPARLAFARQQAFIADASHELRTPLTLIRANAEVLQRARDRLDPRDTALVDDIVGETAHMDRLAAKLLTLARLDAGQFHLESEVVDLSLIAANALRRMRPFSREKGLIISEDYAPEVIVLGDGEALEEAALILVDNAIKHTPPGGRISVRTAKKDGTSELVIEDTGEGIPPEHLPRLGQRFYRVDNARSREAGGAGLGLSIAFAIAAAHGGAVQIESRPGQGTSAALVLRGTT